MAVLLAAPALITVTLKKIKRETPVEQCAAAGRW